jgi:transporter family-2 protein
MKNIGASWLYLIILVCGALQAWGPPMNGVLRNALVNPWLASVVSFLPVLFLLGVVLLCLPRPLPTADGITTMPWWAPLGGVIGAFAVIAGLLFVDKVGAGVFGGLTITANILMSLRSIISACSACQCISSAPAASSGPGRWSPASC